MCDNQDLIDRYAQAIWAANMRLKYRGGRWLLLYVVPENSPVPDYEPFTRDGLWEKTALSEFRRRWTDQDADELLLRYKHLTRAPVRLQLKTPRIQQRRGPYFDELQRIHSLGLPEETLEEVWAIREQLCWAYWASLVDEDVPEDILNHPHGFLVADPTELHDYTKYSEILKPGKEPWTAPCWRWIERVSLDNLAREC